MRSVKQLAFAAIAFATLAPAAMAAEADSFRIRREALPAALGRLVPEGLRAYTGRLLTRQVPINRMVYQAHVTLPVVARDERERVVYELGLDLGTPSNARSRGDRDIGAVMAVYVRVGL